MKNSIGKPDEGKLQVRFDEGVTDSLRNLLSFSKFNSRLSGPTLRGICQNSQQHDNNNIVYMFKKIFGIKTESNKLEDSNYSDNSKKRFSAGLKVKIEQSRIQLMTYKLFMHYWTHNLKVETENPEWQNQAVFFWKYKEPFEKKSLPPNFEGLEKKYFIINELPGNVSVLAGQVMPWFGMLGGGTKYFFQASDKQIPIDNLVKENVINYVEVVELSDSNSDVLTKTDEYFFLMDTTMISFDKGKFFFEQKEISFADAVEIGGLELIRINK